MAALPARPGLTRRQMTWETKYGFYKLGIYNLWSIIAELGAPVEEMAPMEHSELVQCAIFYVESPRVPFGPTVRPEGFETSSDEEVPSDELDEESSSEKLTDGIFDEEGGEEEERTVDEPEDDVSADTMPNRSLQSADTLDLGESPPPPKKLKSI